MGEKLIWKQCYFMTRSTGQYQMLVLGRVKKVYFYQGFVKGEVFCFRYPYFYFRHGESSSTASQQTSTASQISKEINKVPLLLQNLA